MNSEVLLNLDGVNIDWDAFSKARKRVQGHLQLFITKWLSGDAAKGRMMVDRKQRIFSKCLCCHAEGEHLLHVIACTAPETIILRNNLPAGILIWLDKEHTHLAITKFINLGL